MIHERADWDEDGSCCSTCNNEGCDDCACRCEGCGCWIECADHDYAPHPPMCAVCRPTDVTGKLHA